MSEAVQPTPERPEEPTELEVRVSKSPLRCPFCHEDVDPAASDWVVCKQCLARHHGGCWRESKKCASCGDANYLGTGGMRLGSGRTLAKAKLRNARDEEPLRGPIEARARLFLGTVYALAVIGGFVTIATGPNLTFAAVQWLLCGVPVSIPVLAVFWVKYVEAARHRDVRAFAQKLRERRARGDAT